jgi:predicted lysophospholipase L1 biosynthesis ABC-type transport system permease subunit
MQALGFDKQTVVKTLVIEHCVLFFAGLLAGCVTAIIAIIPKIIDVKTLPWQSLATIILILTITGLGCILLASSSALKGNLIAALRKE